MTVTRIGALLGLAAALGLGAAAITWLQREPVQPPLPPRPEVTVRIREGGTLEQLAVQLQEAGYVSSTEQALAYWGQPRRIAQAEPPAVADQPAAVTAVLAAKPAGLPLEGYVFPDTYTVWADDVLAHLTAKALRELTLKLAGEAAGLAATELTPHEVLTLASIVEREVPGDEDRAKVADVFLKRLQLGMPLQSDATVNYVTGKSATRPTAADLATAGAYNTYANRGLPPGPIGSPSLSAIRAVLKPAPNPYYYFLTTPEGQVIYSRTNEEHAAAKRRYLR